MQGFIVTNSRLYVCYLFVLVGGYGEELCLLEDVGSEGGVGQLEDIVRPHQVEPRLVFVHRVQDRLRKKIQINYFRIQNKLQNICIVVVFYLK